MGTRKKLRAIIFGSCRHYDLHPAINWNDDNLPVVTLPNTDNGHAAKSSIQRKIAHRIYDGTIFLRDNAPELVPILLRARAGTSCWHWLLLPTGKTVNSENLPNEYIHIDDFVSDMFVFV